MHFWRKWRTGHSTEQRRGCLWVWTADEKKRTGSRCTSQATQQVLLLKYSSFVTMFACCKSTCTSLDQQCWPVFGPSLKSHYRAHSPRPARVGVVVAHHIHIQGVKGERFSSVYPDKFWDNKIRASPLVSKSFPIHDSLIIPQLNGVGYLKFG
jgi:hypothetical protein